MKVTFLSSVTPLTKSFTLENGELKKISHPRVIDVTSYEEEFETLEELFELFKKHAALGHCLIKGNLSRQLSNESRARHTDSNEATRLLCLDLDGLREITSVEAFLVQLKLNEIDYIVQYSSSMGVVPERGISAHIFILLDKAWHPAMLKQWLIHQNVTNYLLRRNLSLSRTNNTLRWGLDVTVCQNDKLIYIANPILSEGVIDHFVGERIQLVKKTNSTCELTGSIPSAEANRIEVDKLINELRKATGLPERKKAVYKSALGVEYFSRPDQAVVTGIKKERGFVYLNINGGDSWAYYHPENNSEFINNFKGEPIYKTSELVPEYWAEVRQETSTPNYNEGGTIHLAFRDFPTSAYWNGTWNEKTKDLNIAQAKGKEQLHDFLKARNQPIPPAIPDWYIKFNPQSTEIVNLEKQTVNMFNPTAYMRLPPKKVKTVPPMIRKIIFHMCGKDEEVFDHYMNWLSVIMQFKSKTGTSWVFHGDEGTGKGLMFNHILTPLFGMDYTRMSRMSELESQFNGYMEQTLILFIDEAEMAVLLQSEVTNANLKTFIVEPRISIRRMHTLPYIVESFINIIFASNKLAPVIIPPGDRRFNVAIYQPDKFFITDEELYGQVPRELEDFYHFLMTYPADKMRARIPLNNSAKKKMINIGQSSMDIMCKAIITGDFKTLWDERPVLHLIEGNHSGDALAGAYLRLLREIVEGKKDTLLREELAVILGHTIGNIPSTSHKLTSLIKHHGISLEEVTYSGKSAQGITVKWVISDKLKQEVLGK